MMNFAIGGGGSGGGLTTSNFKGPVTPTGTINGINDTFTLPDTPVAGFQLDRNGVLQEGGGGDYTLTGSTIVYAAGSIPQTGDKHVTYYVIS